MSSNPIAIEMIGDCEGTLDQPCLVALLGHELGHYLAHSDALHAVARHLATTSERGRIYLLASELTADRFGLLACQDLHGALRLEMMSVAPTAARGLILDTRAYLAGVREQVEKMLALSDRAQGSTHPEHAIRAYAVALFYESDLYRELTGMGPSLRSIEEVNATLAKLVRPSFVAAAVECVSQSDAKVGVREDEDTIRKQRKPLVSMEELAADVLTHGVSRKLFAGARRLREAITPRDEVPTAREHPPLDPKDFDLQARFEAMVRAKREKK